MSLSCSTALSDSSSWVELSSKRENQFCLSCCCCFTDAFRMPPHPPLAQIPVVFLNSSLKSLTGPRTIFSLFKSSCAHSWEDSSTLRVKLQWPGTSQIQKKPWNLIQLNILSVLCYLPYTDSASWSWPVQPGKRRKDCIMYLLGFLLQYILIAATSHLLPCAYHVKLTVQAALHRSHHCEARASSSSYFSEKLKEISLTRLEGAAPK